MRLDERLVGKTTTDDCKIKITDETALFVSELTDPSVYEKVEPPERVEVPKNMVYVPPGQFIA